MQQSPFSGFAQPGSHLGLERIRALMAALGNPQDKTHVIHVAGTNGKGSVCAMLSSVLSMENYRTGRFSSPPLRQWNDAICIDGEPISDGEVTRMANLVMAAAHSLPEIPTDYELTTALAYFYFAERGCKFSVIETGLGGRDDATNVVDRPLLTILTSISLDHTDRLGKTAAEIAAVKCGILKPGVPCVVAPQDPEVLAVIREQSHALGAPAVLATMPELISRDEFGQRFEWNSLEYYLPLVGNYQHINAAVVMEATRMIELYHEELPISTDSLSTGLASVKWRGRMQMLAYDPTVFFDGAHNPAGWAGLEDTLNTLYPGQNRILVTGVLADKDYGALAKTMTHVHAWFTVPVDSPRALEPEALARQLPDAAACSSIPDGIAAALARQQETGLPVIIFGSLYMAKDVLACFGGAAG